MMRITKGKEQHPNIYPALSVYQAAGLSSADVLSLQPHNNHNLPTEKSRVCRLN